MNRDIGSPPGQGQSERLHEGTVPSAAPDRLTGIFELLAPRVTFPDSSFPFVPPTPSTPSLLEANRLHTLLMPARSLSSVGKFPTGPEGGFSRLEIEVSHSRHVFKLFGTSFFGHKELLYKCRVGLGAPSFPTPVGIYFVTHIYDDDPWWIPPANRAWAWGHAPSRTVYGGTMAPLLKKRVVRSRKRRSNQPDFVAGKAQLADYGYRFHGTNAPRSIGRNQSHGCVRMLSSDARHVARLIKEYIGARYESESENGKYFVLKAPVRLNLVR
ncbi:MAG: L,D-transpeptidase [Deltaproteobacteria bacterium]